MIDPNKISSSETSPDNQQTGWEIVEAEADKMNSRAEKQSTPEEVNATCERVLGRTADDTGRELQLLDFIDGYRVMEYKDPEKHRELLEIAAAGTAVGREDTDYEDGAMKGLKHTITAIMPDGSRVTEERVYSTLEPKLKRDKIAEYLADGVIDSADVGVVEVIHGLLEGQGKDLDQAEASQIREQGGKIKEKVMHHYNEMYKGELFQDDGVDREGLRHLELDNGQKVLLFSGVEFKMLAHVRFAMEMSMGKRTAEDLMQGNPKDDWSLPHKSRDGREMAPPHALSTSLISSDKIHIYKPSEIIYGFNDFEGDGIITMGTEDIASYSNGNSKYSVRSARFNERMMSPDELISETGARREENGETYNEVVLDRYSGKDGGIIQPSCLIVFGKDESVITPLQLKHAEAFRVPIYVIDSEKYGGVKTTWGEKAVPKNDEIKPGASEEDSVVARKSKASTLAALREKIRQINRVEIVSDGGTSKNGGISIHAVKMPFARKIGTGVLSEDFDDASAAVLNAVHVDPKYRGKGIGGAIVDEAISQARREGLKRVNLNSTDMAVEMYKKHGFKINDEDRGSMSLELEEDKDE